MAEEVDRRRTDSLACTVLRLLRDQGPLTKADVAERVDVSRSTITVGLRHLAEAGLVEDAPTALSTGGRPSRPVQLSSSIRLMAISYGAVRFHIAVTDGRLQPLEVRSFRRKQPWRGDTETDRVAAEARALLDSLGVDRPHAVGVAGPVTVAGDITGFVDPLVDRLQAPVVVGRAASAMALGERHVGAGRGCADLVVLRLGATVTSAVIMGGQLCEGATGLAGDLGHLRVEEYGSACACGSIGCLDSFASALAVIRQADSAASSGRSPVLAARQAGAPLDVGDVVAAVAAGDAAAIQVAREAGSRIGSVLAGLVAFTNPERVLLGGVLAELGPEFLAEVRLATYRRAPRPLSADLAIERAQLGDRAGVVGAAHLASDDLFGRSLDAARGRLGVRTQGFGGLPIL